MKRVVDNSGKQSFVGSDCVVLLYCFSVGVYNK